MKDFINETKNVLLDIKKYVVFVFVILVFLLSSLFQIIPIKLFNLDVKNITNLEESFLTLFSYICSLIICIFLYRKTIKKEISNFDKKSFKKNFFYSIKLWIIGLIIMMISTFIFSKIGITSNNNDSVINMFISSPLVYGITLILFSPLLEEIVFRMAFKDIFNGLSFILISGIVFGSIHVIFSITSLLDLLYLIPYCSLGIIFGIIYNKTDNLSYTYIIHLLHNLLTSIIILVLVGV